MSNKICSVELAEELLFMTGLLLVEDDEPSSTTTDDLSAGLIAKDVELTIDEAFEQFPKDQLDELKMLLSSYGVDYSNLLTNTKTGIESSFKNNLKSKFLSSEINDLFHTLTVAENYFKQKVTSDLVKAVYLGSAKDSTFVKNSEQLNSNIKLLKNDLFHTIQKFLKKAEIVDLYNDLGNFINYDKYKSAIKELENKFFSDKGNLIKSHSEKLIPNLKGHIRNIYDRQLFDAYNAAIFLVNFDNVIQNGYDDLIKIDYSVFNNFKESPANKIKYQLNIKSIETTYWKGDDHQSESVEKMQDKLTHTLVSSVPIYNNKNIETGEFMEMKDLYSLAALIRVFEQANYDELKNRSGFKTFVSDPISMLKWYLDEIINDQMNGFTDIFDHFKGRMEVVNSLHNFLYNKSKGYSIAEKEELSEGTVISLFTQTLTNTFGATYLTYNVDRNLWEVKEMHSHNASRISIQNSMYAVLVRKPEQYYDKVKADKRIEKIFEDVNLSDEILLPSGKLNSNNIPNQFKNKLITYFNSNFSLKLDYDSLTEVLESWFKNNTDSTISVLKSSLNDINDNLSKVKEKVDVNEGSIDKITQSETISDLISDSKIQDLIDIYLNNFIVKAIMTINTLKGDKLPTFKVATLTNNDVELFELDQMLRSEDRIYKSILYGNGKVIVGTGTKLEITNGKDSKAAAKMEVSENFISNFEYDFLRAITNSFNKKDETKAFGVMLGNYSDKSTILNKLISVDAKIGDKRILDLSMNELLETIRTQSLDYYTDLFNDLFMNYNKLFGAIGYDAKLDYSSTKNFNKNIEILNNYLLFNNLSEDLKEAFKVDKSIIIEEERSYSVYNKGKDKLKAINYQLVDYYNIFNTKTTFNKFIKFQENKFTKKYPSKHIDFTENKNKDEEELAQDETIIDFYKVVNEDFEKNEDFNDNGKQLVVNTKDELNPLLRKYIWINGLFRNEYLYLSTKGEYMHPHKAGIEYRSNPKHVIKDNFDILEAEMDGRLKSMAKRNVTNTATIELGTRRNRLGTADTLNLAVIKDHESQTFNYSGITKDNQEVHDGSSWIPYAYSKMVENSYPGKGYAGTKKQFATLVTEFGVTIKKDAEMVITNNSIRNSSNSEIKMKHKLKQSYGIPIDLDFKYVKMDLGDYDYYLYEDGSKYKLNGYIIENGSIKVYKDLLNDNDEAIDSLESNLAFNTLYDIWNVLGAEYVVDKDNNWSEWSQELIYDLVTNYGVLTDSEDDFDVASDNKVYPLKNKMIHLLSNKSAIKAGARNINEKNMWESSEDLMYSSYINRNMGPQLDAYHDADNSQIKEITQVISAISQNGNSNHLATEVYEDIANIIKKAAEPYINASKRGDKNLYTLMSRKFTDAVMNSNNVSLAKTIMSSFSDDNLDIPFSNQHFFQLFVRDLITRMNSEFITRYYSGISAVLNPSHNIIKVYEDKNGNITKHEDLAKNAFDWAKENNLKLNNNEIITEYLKQSDYYGEPDVTSDKIVPTDIVIFDGVEWNLNTIEKYIEFKELTKGKIVRKVQHKPRDLKPSEITFKLPSGEQRNVFDLDSVKLRYFYNNLNKDSKYYNTLQQFAKYFGISLSDTKSMKLYLNQWTQRNLHMLDEGYIMKDLSEFTDENGKIDFKFYFKNKDFYKTTYKDDRSNYINAVNSNSVKVIDYNFKAAELILPNIYKSKFNTGNDSISKIKAQGSDYFVNQLLNKYDESNDQDDIKIILTSGENPVYIRFVEKLPSFDENINIKKDEEYDRKKDEMVKVVNRVDKFGKKLYTIPERNARVRIENGKEIIYLKSIEKNTFKDNEYNLIHPDLKNNLFKLIKSFKGKIDTMIPFMNTVVDSKSVINGDLLNTNIHEITYKAFKYFSNYRGETELVGNPSEWFDLVKGEISSELGNKMYASWLKSHEFFAARIPAQSMQSFMEMKNVGYFGNDGNDAYVSVWQIWLQGSDFDIDKAYIIGSGFDSNSQFESWTPLSGYSTIEQLNELEKMPLPKGITIKEDFENGIDVGQEFESVILELFQNNRITDKEGNLIDKITDISVSEWGSVLDYLHDMQTEQIEEIPKNLPPNTIKALSSALRKANNNNGNIKINTDKTDLVLKGFKDVFIDLLNKHSLSKEYLNKNFAINNSIVSKIKQIISTPSNQLIANEPVDVQRLHDAADFGLKKRTEVVEKLSSWDMLSMFKQQKDAAVGKDDVGISANGLKVFFALTNYYNNIYEKAEISPDNIFVKKLILENTKGNLEEFNISTLSDVTISNKQIEQLSKYLARDLNIQKEDAAVIISSFTSAATDNAKELLMAKLNASVELASMHIYMLSLGIDIDRIAIFMNSEVASDVVNQLNNQNLFFGEANNNVSRILKDLKDSYNGNEKLLTQLSTFKSIYEGGQEFKMLSSFLKINRRTSANIDEMSKFLSNFETATYVREDIVFGSNLNKYKDYEENKSQILEDLYAYNPALVSYRQTDVIKILDDANRIGIIAGGFDFREYIKVNNNKYRDIVKRYYNLIKDTVNIFDVIEELPHFSEMINGLKIYHDLGNKSSKKYNFAYDTFLTTIRNKGTDIVYNKNVNNILANKGLRVKTDEKVIRNSLLWFDKKLVSKWLEQDSSSEISLNVNELLKLSGEESITLYDEGAAYNTKNTFDVNIKDETPTIIHLNSDEGVANFKKIMEEVVLEILKSGDGDFKNDFVNSLRVENRKNNFGQNQNFITSTFPMSQLNSPVNIQKFETLVSDFNDLDLSVKKLVNANNKKMNWRDLFYVYNLVVNNESYGDKRLTPIFDDYIKEKDSLGYDYMTFSAKVDKNEINLFEWTEGLDMLKPETVSQINKSKNPLDLSNVDISYLSDEDSKIVLAARDSVEYSILFYAFQNKGSLTVPNVGGSTNNKILTVNNPDFVIITNLTPISNEKKKWMDINKLMKLIKSNSLIINFKCN